MTYNYLENEIEDVKEYIKENYESLDEVDEEQLNEELWTADSVTGNGSGSYYCNAWKAAEALAHNWDLLNEALREFCCEDVDITEKGEEWCDVTIRCYLLSQAISKAIEELESECF